jgi:hypothetical protein
MPSISFEFGVLEYWSVGVMMKGQMALCPHSNTPTLQYSINAIFEY